MKTRSTEPIASLALAFVGALIAVTCAAGNERAQSPSPPAPAPSLPAPSARAEPAEPTAGAASSAPAANAGAEVADASPEASGVEGAPIATSLALPRLHAALAALEGGRRSEPVRILWLGDSHTAADFWTHAARKPLQRRFGNGGPGYVMIGLSAYRHDGVKVTNEGAWRREPAAPASSSRQLDGIFGLGGQRVKPAGADARSAVTLAAGAVTGEARWTVVYRADADDKLRVSVRGGETKTLGAKDGQASPSGSGLRRASLEGAAESALDIAISGGAPEVFGVFVESKRPGVVLDTLGINGARAATAMSWDGAAWVAEAKARRPSLLVLAYGTNEAAGAWAAERYEKSLEALATRASQVSDEADCLVIGPPDMAGANGKSAPRVLEHDEVARRVAGRVGCSFFSAFSAMGGEGAFARWAKETPPLAAADRVHLRSGGYEKLGAAVADALVAGYRGPASR